MSERAVTKLYRVKVYVGPVHVAYHARLAKQARMWDILEGTEHVHATVASAELRDETGRQLLRLKVGEAVYGQPGGVRWRDVEILRAV
jgi:hypothetical protein